MAVGKGLVGVQTLLFHGVQGSLGSSTLLGGLPDELYLYCVTTSTCPSDRPLTSVIYIIPFNGMFNGCAVLARAFIMSWGVVDLVVLKPGLRLPCSYW